MAVEALDPVSQQAWCWAQRKADLGAHGREPWAPTLILGPRPGELSQTELGRVKGPVAGSAVSAGVHTRPGSRLLGTAVDFKLGLGWPTQRQGFWVVLMRDFPGGQQCQGPFPLTIPLSLVALRPWQLCTTPGSTSLCKWCP